MAIAKYVLFTPSGPSIRYGFKDSATIFRCDYCNDWALKNVEPFFKNNRIHDIKKNISGNIWKEKYSIVNIDV